MVATFQCSDRNFLHYRGFLDLHSRLLLDLQYDIESLETELDELDEWDMTCAIGTRSDCLRCKSRDRRESDINDMPEEFHEAGFIRTRPEVMKELHVKLMEYDNALLQSKAVNSLKRPSNRDHRSITNWFDAKKPLVAREARFIHRKEDLVSLHDGRECSGFDGFVEQCLNVLDKLLGKINCHIIRVSNTSFERRTSS